MSKMFESATLKLTGWYLFIIFLICLLFSVIVYQISSRELSMRLNNQVAATIQRVPVFRTTSTQLQAIFDQQLREGQRNLKLNLLYTNISVLLIGGAGSYVLARRTLQPIEEAHEAQSRFVGDVSHELRTPLSTIQTEIEVLLRDKTVSKNELIELLRSNLEEVGKLQTVSGTLLRLSQLQDQNEVDAQELDVKHVAEEAVKRVAQQSRTKKITINTVLTSIRVCGDELMLIELLSIVLDNAIKYSFVGGSIEIHVYKRNNMAVVKVTDHGAGIKQKDLPFIFDRFYRGDVSRSKNTVPGYGLGLSLADQIVDLHHGTITASSRKSNTAFTIKIPTNVASQ